VSSFSGISNEVQVLLRTKKLLISKMEKTLASEDVSGVHKSELVEELAGYVD
jgi:hypothetical protein